MKQMIGRSLAFWCFIFLLYGTCTGSSAAQTQPGESGWSDTAVLAQNAGATVVIGDSMGAVHLFYVEGASDQDSDPSQQAIMYMSGAGSKWSQPGDVLVSPNRTRIYLNAVEIDTNRYIHLLWNDDTSLFHSVAHIENAKSPLAWRTDHILNGQIPIGDMALDKDGKIHVVVRDSSFSVSYLSSQDGGISWGAPTPIDVVQDQARYAIDGIKLALSENGTLHATWFYTAAEVTWNLWSVWYARSTDSGQSWDGKKEMAAPRFGDSDIALDGQGNLHLVYGKNIGSPDGRWHQWSRDGGETWSLPESLYPQFEYASGVTGGYGFATDSAGVLHLVNSFGNVEGDASAYHMFWQADRWSPPQMLLDTSTHAHYPRLTITLGNQLQFFAFSDRAAENGILYRTGLADAPPIQPQAISAPPQAEVAAVVQATPVPSIPQEIPAETRIPLVVDQQPPSSPSPFSNPLFLGLMPVLALILITLLLRRSTFRHR